MKILELFAGIGGVSAALADQPNCNATVVGAIDIDTTARQVYQANFSTPYETAELASFDRHRLADYAADLWWLSPPCLPFTIRGHRKDLSDPRNTALLRIVDHACHLKPDVLVIENVPGFEVSQTFSWLSEQLRQAAYKIETVSLCPTEFHWPNRRKRVYAIAWRKTWMNGSPSTSMLQNQWLRRTSLAELLDLDIRQASHPSLYLPKDLIARYHAALDRIELHANGNSNRPTACFGASYGRSILRAGSYLQTHEGLRRFAPHEVKRLLGFSMDFQLPSESSDATSTSTQRAWRLLGNSLSIPVVGIVLTAIVESSAKAN